jgi:hypothetical protein
MKIVKCLLLCMCIVLPLLVQTGFAIEETSKIDVPETSHNKESKPLLSALSEQELMEYLQEKGVAIPTCFTAEDWAHFAKQIVIEVEKDSETPFFINYSITLEFAESIRKVVNEYYGITITDIAPLDSKVLSNSTTDLQDSVPIGAWIDSYEDYNCYAYAIEETAWLDPGFFQHAIDLAGNPSLGSYVLDTLDPYRLAEYVKDDLLNLDHSRVTISSADIFTDNLCTNEHVICVRSGSIDYHFMQYSNGNWLHKPSYTQPLRYKYWPTDGRVWTNEAIYKDNYIEATIEYNSPIVYISYNGHNWNSYTSHNTGTHTRYCSICNDFESEGCDLEYVSAGSSGHYQRCSLCGYRSTTVAHNFTYTYSSGTSHTMRCTDCGYTTTGSCSINYIYTGSGTNHKHNGYCYRCEHVYKESCTNVYQYYGQVDGIHKHQTVCSKCDHVTGSLSNCIFKGTSTVCSHCKHDKGISGGTIMKKPSAGAVQTYQE